MVTITFKGATDRYNGITVDSQEEPCEISQFLNQLNDSVTMWSEQNKRCIWFKVNIKDAAWVPLLANVNSIRFFLSEPHLYCVTTEEHGFPLSYKGVMSSEGFNFHHSRGDFVMMYKWLPTDRSSNLPPACHTNLGVGGMVFNDKNQILVVTENYLEFPHWKLPGGYVERGEDIKDAAVREIKEETGIDATFESMVTLRHTHNVMFGNSDIYVIVLLKAASEKITKSDIEIKACKWMDIEEYLNHPDVHDFNRFIAKQALDLKGRKLKLGLCKETLKMRNNSWEMTSLVLEDA